MVTYSAPTMAKVLACLSAAPLASGTPEPVSRPLTTSRPATKIRLRGLRAFNTATGVYSPFSNTSGFFNSATGAYSLANNISGNHNTATGYGALYRNTADDNTANGFGALFVNTTGSDNTAVGE